MPIFFSLSAEDASTAINPSNTVPTLNQAHKGFVKGILDFIFEDIRKLNPLDAIKAFQAIGKDDISESDIEILKKQEVWDGIAQINEILSHPCPQNRKVGDPSAASGNEDGAIDGKVYYWTNGFGSKHEHEPQGLLGLTARANNSVNPVTKEALVVYIHELIALEISKQQQKLEESNEYSSLNQNNNNNSPRCGK